ncbi:MAG: hypothetical protein ACYTXA_02515 [Nostoc sp.]
MYKKLWDNPDFPKCEWKHVDVIDVTDGDPNALLHTCEACGREDVRYVHQLKHDLWDEIIEVGCICAGNLTGDIDEAKRLEKEARNRTSRRDRWLERNWKTSRNGNPYLKHRQQGIRYHIIVFKSKYGQWNFRVTVEKPSNWTDDPSPFAPVNPIGCNYKKSEYEGTVWYKSPDQAKFAAFDALPKAPRFQVGKKSNYHVEKTMTDILGNHLDEVEEYVTENFLELTFEDGRHPKDQIDHPDEIEAELISVAFGEAKEKSRGDGTILFEVAAKMLVAPSFSFQNWDMSYYDEDEGERICLETNTQEHDQQECLIPVEVSIAIDEDGDTSVDSIDFMKNSVTLCW